MLTNGVIINLIYLFLLKSVWCQSPPSSPCPEVFSYVSDNNGWYGVVVVSNPAYLGSEVLLKVVLSSPKFISGGRLQIDKKVVQERITANEPLEYKVIFLNNNLPKVDEISLNEKKICVGSTPYRNSLTLRAKIRNIISNPSKPNLNNNQPTYRPTTQTSNVGNDCGVSSTRTGFVSLIYGGKDTQRGDWPWSVAIFFKKRTTNRNELSFNYICGGSLISKNKVLTAAHCLYDGPRIRPREDLLLKFGTNNLNDFTEESQSRDVSSFKIGENYESTILQNDIAIITTTREVSFNAYIKPVCIWTNIYDQDLLNEDRGVVVGWGLNAYNQLVLEKQKTVEMPIVSNEICKNSKSEFHMYTSDTTLCAGRRDGSGPCLGDSGGGLYVQVQNKWYIRGIVSKALVGSDRRICDLFQYVIFTDVAKYKSWVYRNM